MNRISQRERFINLSNVDKSLENIDSLNELVILYQQKIQLKLDEITPDKVLQGQIKHSLGFE